MGNQIKVNNTEDIVIINPIVYKKYLWKKDIIDKRDIIFIIKTKKKKLSRTFSLKKKMPSVLDQGKLGCSNVCVIVNNIYYLDIKNRIKNPELKSRLFIHYNTKNYDKLFQEKCYYTLRNMIKSINKYGICYEKDWEYNLNNIRIRPNDKCYTDAKFQKRIKYKRINKNINDIKNILFSGFPVIFGFDIYINIHNTNLIKKGVIPIPKMKSNRIGGHSVLIIGWRDDLRLFGVQNSFGNVWGNNGFGWISYDYICNPNIKCDLWVLEY